MYYILMSLGVLLLDTSETKMEAGSHPAMKEIHRSFWCGQREGEDIPSHGIPLFCK
jgi:hypothetical protein